MRRTFSAGLIAVGFLAGSVISPSPAQAASTTAPTFVPQAVTRVKTKRVDIDGDGRKDTVRLYKLSAKKWRVTVRTAKGKRASKRFTSTLPRSWGVKSPWAGARKMDGRKGAEIRVMVKAGNGVKVRVFTWRKGRLVNEPKIAHKAWRLGGTLPTYQSYRLFTSAKVRYADVAQLTLTTDDFTTCSADVKRYAWKASKWVFVKSYSIAAADGVCAKFPGL